MKFLIGVLDFGKIKKAEIDVSNFSIFVGNNNSGKSYMMQLIYGILQKVFEFNIPTGDYEIVENMTLEWGEKELLDYEKKLNVYLEKNKEQIVESIFHKSIPVKSLYVKMTEINQKAIIQFDEWAKPEYFINDKRLQRRKSQMNVHIKIQKNKTNEVLDSMDIMFFDNADKNYIKSCVEKNILPLILDFLEYKRILLFLPASRTGMLLLYKYFFAEKDKGLIMEIGQSAEKDYRNELGLSVPVYDFLQFLLRHTFDDKTADSNKKLIDFIEKHLIDGCLQQQGEETVYIPENTDRSIPLYLSSSMVNELTPMIKVLTGSVNYNYLLYDEIETCLHPEKQGEMARLLMRLNNAGKRLIVSTHSDTMASKINNLLLLSFSDEPKKEKKLKLDKLNLTEDDLLKSPNIHVYQFSNQSDGTSIVNELEFRKVPYTGYDFSQFMDSNQNLYDESVTIMG